MNKTTIEWTDYTWNPVTGCHKVSQGCKICYAETMTTRFHKQWGMKSFRDVTMWEERLFEPEKMGAKLHGKKVFVCDMSDLFHEDVSFEFITNVLRVIARCKQTTFQILTKRPQRAIEWLEHYKSVLAKYEMDFVNPFGSNVWFGVSCEDQANANERIPLLLQIPAAVRFLSCEPLIGSIDLTKVEQIENRKASTYYTTNVLSDEFYPHQKIHWVITGGESGHGARPMHPDWVRSLRDQCKAANVPFFFKQWGAYLPFTEGISRGKGSTKWLDQNDLLKSNKVIMNDKVFLKMSKSKSGNLLDGKQHLEFPQPATI